MIKYRFCSEKDKDFARALRSNVNDYFKSNSLSKGGGNLFYVKTVLYTSLYLIPFIALVTLGFTNTWLLMSLWLVMGFGKALIGLNIMHDAIHGSVTKNKFAAVVLRFSATIIGVDWLIWKIQHNVIHHTYTNIEDADEDILPRVVFRYSEHQPKYWIHKFQHIYAPIFYCVPLLEWITTKDFVKAIDYRRDGFIKKADFAKEFSLIVLRKLFYHGVFIALPLLVMSVSIWTTVWMIFLSHCITGIVLALVFQTAHVVPETSFTKSESEEIDECWTTHQMLTTSNYGVDNRLLSFLVGGLNFQVEHHLFPDVCHVHYPEISKIVKATAEEHEIPYLSLGSFSAAVHAHFSHLKRMGNMAA